MKLRAPSFVQHSFISLFLKWFFKHKSYPMSDFHWLIFSIFYLIFIIIMTFVSFKLFQWPVQVFLSIPGGYPPWTRWLLIHRYSLMDCQHQSRLHDWDLEFPHFVWTSESVCESVCVLPFLPSQLSQLNRKSNNLERDGWWVVKRWGLFFLMQTHITVFNHCTESIRLFSGKH